MCATKYLLLLCFLPVIYSASYSGCTSRTRKQAPTVADYLKKEFNLEQTFDCDCAERAEGLAWATAIGAPTEDYSRYYNIYNITQVEKHDQLKDVELKSMLKQLVEANPQMGTPTLKRGRYGCAFSSGRKMGDNDVTHALTCIFAKTVGQCHY